jgi:esterase/lipase
VTVPLLAIGTEADGLFRPECSRVIVERASSSIKRMRMFSRSGHEMLQSLEKDAVMAVVMEFIGERAALPGEPAPQDATA